MKIIVTILALLNGLWMLADGIYVMATGKYIGPEKPGPWANMFQKAGMDIFKFGPVFVFLGLLWLIFVSGLWSAQSWARQLGLLIAVASLWYLPVGTIVSVVILVVLLGFREKLGMR